VGRRQSFAAARGDWQRRGLLPNVSLAGRTRRQPRLNRPTSSVLSVPVDDAEAVREQCPKRGQVRRSAGGQRALRRTSTTDQRDRSRPPSARAGSFTFCPKMSLAARCAPRSAHSRLRRLEDNDRTIRLSGSPAACRIWCAARSRRGADDRAPGPGGGYDPSRVGAGHRISGGAVRAAVGYRATSRMNSRAGDRSRKRCAVVEPGLINLELSNLTPFGCSSQPDRLHRRSARSACNIANKKTADALPLARRHRQPHPGHGGRLHDGSVVRLGGIVVGWVRTHLPGLWCSEARWHRHPGHRALLPLPEAVGTRSRCSSRSRGQRGGVGANRTRHRARGAREMDKLALSAIEAAFHWRARALLVSRAASTGARGDAIDPSRRGTIRCVLSRQPRSTQ